MLSPFSSGRKCHGKEVNDNMWLLAATGKAVPPVFGVLTGGYAAEFFMVLLFAALMWLHISRARSGRPVPPIRRLPGLDALEEIVGRATEMGRALALIPGIMGVADTQTISQYYVLGHLAKSCARYDTKLLALMHDPLVYAVDYEIVRQAYLEAGRPEAFSPDSVQFLTNWQFAYAASVMAVFERDRPAAVVEWGNFYAETLLIVEKAAELDMVQVGATAATFNLPFIVACCDYFLIAEEMYAASAYLSKEPILVGTIVGEDWLKMLILAAILVGTVMAQVQHTNWLARILGK